MFFVIAIVLLAAGGRLAAAQTGVSGAGDPVQMSEAAPTPGQAYSLPPDKLAKAKILNKIRLALDLSGSLWGLAVLWLLLETRAAAGLERLVERVSARPWKTGLVFFLAFIVITAVLGLPLEAIGHSVSSYFGISVQGWAGWFGDQAKALGISLFGALGLLLFNGIVRRWPRRYWLYAWVAMLPLMVLLTMGEPLLEPVFNQYEPLAEHHAGLVSELEKVVARTGTNIPPERMFLMKASLKTNGLNAYVSGMGATRRIVVWDTTAGRIPDDEVQFIFGHESGHYVLNHIGKGLAAAAAFLFFVFWGCAGVAEWMARRFGERWGIEEGGEGGEGSPVASRTGFVVLIFVVSVLMFLAEPVENTVSRYFEHQADVYGQEAIHGLVADPQKTAVSSFNHLGEAWLEDPDPNPVVEFWLYSHPSVQDRARFAAGYNPWANGGRGEFFAK